MKYKLTAVFSQDESAEDAGELLEQVRQEVTEAIENCIGEWNPDVRIEEVS